MSRGSVGRAGVAAAVSVETFVDVARAGGGFLVAVARAVVVTGLPESVGDVAVPLVGALVPAPTPWLAPRPASAVVAAPPFPHAASAIAASTMDVVMSEEPTRTMRDPSGPSVTARSSRRGAAGVASARAPDELYEEYPELVSVWQAFHDARARRRAVEWLRDEELIDDATAERLAAAHLDPPVP